MAIDLDSMTIGQARELAQMFQGVNAPGAGGNGLDDFGIGQTVIIRTYSAGV